MLQFDEDYFKGEEREGFFVEEMMKRAWAAQLEVVKEIEKICKAHGLTYYADWGTLLGAVRHKGFIPWDDDIDICMKRKDYEQFLQYAKTELPQGYRVLSLYNDVGWKDPFARVVNTDKIRTDAEHLERFHGFPFCCGIDVFPLDYMPRDPQEESVMTELMSMCIGVKQLLIKPVADEGDDRDPQEVIEAGLQALEQFCNVSIDRTKGKKYIINQVNILIDRLGSMYHEEESDDMGPMHHYVVYHNCRIRKETFGEPVWLPFENTELPVPTHYMDWVVEEFGKNYMTPIRTPMHDYPFYGEQRRMLEEAQRKQI